MTEARARWRAFASFIVKILVVLVFPLDGFFYSYGTGWQSILLSVGRSPYGDYIFLPAVQIIPREDFLLAINPINTILAGLLILLPCLIFEQQLNSRPISKSIRGRTVAACFLTWGFSILLLPFATGYWGRNPLYYTVNYAPVLAIAFFVILPLISRETTIRSISSDHQQLSLGFITSTLRKRFRREKVLTGLLWFSLVFSPFMFFAMISAWSSNIMIISFFYMTSVFGGGPVFGGLAIFNAEIQFTAAIALSLPLSGLLASLRFVFVRDVFRYQSRQITKSRLVSMGLMGELLPSAAVTLFALLTTPLGGGFFPLFYPLPILPLIGFAFLRFSKFVPAKEELWSDYEHRMWYEKEQEPHVPEPVDETIKVPISYLLVSQFRRRQKD